MRYLLILLTLLATACTSLNERHYEAPTRDTYIFTSYENRGVFTTIPTNTLPH